MDDAPKPPPLTDADLARMRADARRLVACRSALGLCIMDAEATSNFLDALLSLSMEQSVLRLADEVERLRGLVRSHPEVFGLTVRAEIEGEQTQ